jgi:hypothetical protein
MSKQKDTSDGVLLVDRGSLWPSPRLLTERPTWLRSLGSRIGTDAIQLAQFRKWLRGSSLVASTSAQSQSFALQSDARDTLSAEGLYYDLDAEVIPLH